MNPFRTILLKIRSLGQRGVVKEEIDEELRFHIELRTAENIGAGMPPEDAAREARKRFGNVQSVREECRDARGAAFGETVMQDICFGARLWRRNPGFTVVVLLTLALGIGAVASVFSIVQGVLLKSPPYPKPEQIVLISAVKTTGEPYAQGSAAAEWQEWRQEAKSFSAMAGYTVGKDYLFLSDKGQPVTTMTVTSDFFKVLGVQPQVGRAFLPSDFPALWSGAHPGVVIISHDLWQRQFHGDTNIIGRVIRSNNNAGEPDLDTVIGVMPPDLRVLPSPSMSHMPGYDPDGHVEEWVPAVHPKMLGPKSTYWSIVGRLRDGTGLAAAQAELTVIAARQGQADHTFEGITAKAELLTTYMNDQARRLLIPLSGAVALVFLIACGSVAGLLLARGLQRQREYAVRCALGAGKWRIAGQSFTESLLLALSGGVLGAALAMATVKVLKATAGAAIPRLDAVTLGWPMLVFCFAATLLAAMLAGFAPAFRASRLNATTAAKGGTRTGANRADTNLLRWVAMVQTALTLALLVGAGLLIRTVANLAHLRPGYDTEHIVSMTVTEIRLGQQFENTNADWGLHVMDFNRRALSQVQALPGVKSAAWAYGLPLNGHEFLADIQTGGNGDVNSEKLKDEVDIPVRTVTPEYFETVGQQLLAGRTFGPAENDTNAVNYAIINQAMARQYFGNTDPVGKTFRMILVFSGVKIYKSFVETRILGVVANASDVALTRKAEPEFYLPYWEIHSLFRSLVVRATGDPRSVISSVQHALRAVEPTVAIEDVKTFEQIRHDSIAPQLFTMRLLTGFSIVAGALALIGIYGVLSLTVASRRQEMAIRIAIGAPRRNILALILGQGLKLVGVGVALGTCVAVASTGVLRSFLFGVEPTDPFTIASVIMLFVLVAALACYIPARRATRIDPMEALRSE
jgi:putative ABC transport system permease protein